MALGEITDKQIWEEFLPLRQNGLFLQSWQQKRLYETLGQKTWLYQYAEGDREIRSLVTKVEARRGTFFFLPYGPLFKDQASHELLGPFFRALSERASEEKAVFIRVSPFVVETQENAQLFKSAGLRPAPIHMLAETLWLKDLKGKTEDELMEEMEKKHRNLVRRALKDGVVVETTTEIRAVDDFLPLMKETVERHQFVPYPDDYFKNQLLFFAEDDAALMYEGKFEDDLVVSAMVMHYGDAGAYHHGASSSDPKFRKIPVSYLVQWEAILESHRRGAKFYNFWGVAPYTLDADGKRVYDSPKHPFNGITHFKCGFGGRRMDLLPCHDLVLSWKYWFTWAIESFRKWKRGF